MDTYLTRDNQKYIIRQPVENDAEGIMDYSKTMFASTDQTLTTLEEYSTKTVEQEKAWINNFNENPNAIILLAELDEQIVGLLFFAPIPKKKSAHTGEFGVSIHPGFRGLGIGKTLIQALLEWAKANATIEKVFLTVNATNPTAISLYKSLGFIEEGRHIKALKQPWGEYVDVLQMYVETK